MLYYIHDSMNHEFGKNMINNDSMNCEFSKNCRSTNHKFTKNVI